MPPTLRRLNEMGLGFAVAENRRDQRTRQSMLAELIYLSKHPRRNVTS
ncbi:MAG: hypothetical protein ABW137_32200 [Mycobacterium sp.]